MDYGYVIRVAWALSRRHPFLWVLGLFAMSGVSGCAAVLQAPVWLSGGVIGLAPAVFGTLEALGSLSAPNLSIVVAILAATLIASVGLTVASSIATAGMARATIGLVGGEAIASGDAWRAGLHRFPRYLGLALLGFAYVVVAFVAVAAVIALTLSVAQSGSSDGSISLIVLGLVALGAVLASVLGLVVFVVAAQYAQLELAMSDVGPMSALRSAIALVRREPGATLVLWLIAIAFGVLFSLLLAIAFVLLLAGLVGLGAVVYFATASEVTTGVPPTTVVYGALALALVVGMLWAGSAFVNTFLWSYWAAAYLRLRRPQPASLPLS